jgi:thioredoxin-like negative regulator of GroEL
MTSNNTVDVRSKKDVNMLETMIKRGPITLVLIYADWCGHCTRFKDAVWNELIDRPRKANLASIHHDQLDKTLLKDAKIKGYPSVLVVGKDGKPAVFKGPEDDEETNAMPSPDLKTLETIAKADADMIMREQEEDVSASIMSPPDAREDILSRPSFFGRLMGRPAARQEGGRLLKLLKRRANSRKIRTRRQRRTTRKA